MLNVYSGSFENSAYKKKPAPAWSDVVFQSYNFQEEGELAYLPKCQGTISSRSYSGNSNKPLVLKCHIL